jgi:hypothetical protein
MTIADVLADASRRLEEAGIPYMVTGSMASSVHGEPRSTLDLDVAVDPTPQALDRFLDALPPAAYYVDRDTAMAALSGRGQFNVIESGTGWKIDLIVRKDRPFSREEFDRRRATDILGTPTYVVSAEDMIIAKLEWALAGDSGQQLQDVAGILTVSGDTLDYAYLQRWISELGLAELWSRFTSPPA